MKISYFAVSTALAFAAVAAVSGSVAANPGDAVSTSAAPAAAVAATGLAADAKAVDKPGADATTPANPNVTGLAASSPSNADAAAPNATQSVKTVARSDSVSDAKPAAPVNTLRISIDLGKQQLTVKEHGKVLHSWPISSGRTGYRTITGTFKPQWMTRMHYSRKYDDAPMPNSIFFSGGFAIHATYATGLLGRPASHGCVRLSPGNAKRLYALVEQHGRQATTISVFGAAREQAPAVAQNRPVSRYATTSVRSGRNYSRYEGSTWSGDNVQRKPVREAPPKIIYRNGQAYVYVGPQKARQYWRQQRNTGGYYNY